MANREVRLLSRSSHSGGQSSGGLSLLAVDPYYVDGGEQQPAQLLRSRTATSTSTPNEECLQNSDDGFNSESISQGMIPSRDVKGKQPLVERPVTLAPTSATADGKTFGFHNIPQCVQDLKRLLRREADPEAMAPLHAGYLCAALKELGMPHQITEDELCYVFKTSGYADENGTLNFEQFLELVEDHKLLQEILTYEVFKKEGKSYFPRGPLGQFFEILDETSETRLSNYDFTEFASLENVNVEITTPTATPNEKHTKSISMPHYDDELYAQSILRVMFPKCDDKGKQILEEPLVTPASTPRIPSIEAKRGILNVDEEIYFTSDDFTEEIIDETAESLVRYASIHPSVMITYEQFLKVLRKEREEQMQRKEQ